MSRAIAFLGLAAASCAVAALADHYTHEEAPGGASRATPAAAPATLRRIELTGAALRAHQSRFSYHDVVRAPAYEGLVPPLDRTTILFLRVPDVARAAMAAPEIAVVRPDKELPDRVPLLRDGEGNLLAVEVFDLRDTDGDGRAEILFIAHFRPPGDPPPRPFRRAFHIQWTDDGRPVKSLATWILRDEPIATIDDLAARVTEIREKKVCPRLDEAMGQEEDTIVLALRCMIDEDRRADLAASAFYPMEVLLKDGHVRTLRKPADFVEVYDDIIDGDVREAVRRGKVDWAYSLMLVGRGGPMVSHGSIVDIPSLDPGAHRKLQERLATDERAIWQPRRRDVVCRTRRATHVFADSIAGRVRPQLSTWNDPKADVNRTRPDRVMFGYLQMHGTCGNDHFTFVGPGPNVDFHHITCGSDEPEYSIGVGDEIEPCLNHRVWR